MKSKDSSAIRVRAATVSDAAVLVALGRRTFIDTYAEHNDPSHFADYIDTAFRVDQLNEELTDPGAKFLMAERDGEVIGYAKVRSGPAPDCVSGDHPIELERIYADRHVIGRGVGSSLMQASLDAIALLGGDIAWLGVWERNERAIQFYRKWGFETVGIKTFAVGSDVQTDVVMVRPL